MDEKERLTAYKKAELAQKHEQLNLLLRQKREKEKRISDLMREINRLREEADELDEQFHRLVITCEPDEIVTIKKSEPVSDKQKALMDAIKKFAQTNPDALDGLTAILNKRKE